MLWHLSQVHIDGFRAGKIDDFVLCDHNNKNLGGGSPGANNSEVSLKPDIVGVHVDVAYEAHAQEPVKPPSERGYDFAAENIKEVLRWDDPYKSPKLVIEIKWAKRERPPPLPTSFSTRHYQPAYLDSGRFHLRV